MESKYKSIKNIGEGAFSSVILALNIETNEKVAIKKMKKRRWKDTAAQAEISALQMLHHENIIRLLDVFREDYRSFLVFECMDCDLNELVVSRNGRRLPDTVVLDVTYQVLNGLDFIHQNGLFHRDIKPENVLIRRHITATGPGGSSAIVVEAKIADFGLVHDMDFSRPLTDYISTRWYRAPEVLLNCANYSTPIDVWAVGTIVAELATLRPLFPGNNQIDQLRRIFDVLGTPRISPPVAGNTDDEAGPDSNGSWYEGAVHARKLGITFVPSTRKPLQSVISDVSAAIIQLVDYILVLNPAERPTAKDALGLVSHMLDNQLGEPLPQDEDAASESASASRAEEPQTVPTMPAAAAVTLKQPSSSATASAVVPDSNKAPPAMGKTHTSPTFGPVSSASAVAAAAVNGATPSLASIIASTHAAAGETNASSKVANCTTPSTACNDATFAPPQMHQPEAIRNNLAALVQDGRVSFTPRDKFDQQLVNTQIYSQNNQQQHTQAQQQQHDKQLATTQGPPPGVQNAAITMRPSCEVSIVKGPHREPLVDPRAAGVAALAVASSAANTSVNQSRDDLSGHTGVGQRMRSHTVSTVSSMASMVSPSLDDSVSLRSSAMSSRASASFSVSDIPSPLSGSDANEPQVGLGLYAGAPSVIGNAGINQTLPAIQRPSPATVAAAPALAPTQAPVLLAMESSSATSKQSSLGSSPAGSSHVRRAPVIAQMATAPPSANDRKSTGSGKDSLHGMTTERNFVSTKSTSELDKPLPQLHSSAQNQQQQQQEQQQKKQQPTKILGIRAGSSANGNSNTNGNTNGSGKGSPLIKRAFSMKKKSSTDSKPLPKLAKAAATATSTAAVPLPLPSQQLSPVIKRSRSELHLQVTAGSPSMNGSAKPQAQRSDTMTGATEAVAAVIGNRLEISPEAQAVFNEHIDLSSVNENTSVAKNTLTKPKKDEWIANTQLMRQRLAGNNAGSSSSASASATVARKRRSSVGDVRQLLTVHDSNIMAAPRRLPVADVLFVPPGKRNSQLIDVHLRRSILIAEGLTSTGAAQKKAGAGRAQGNGGARAAGQGRQGAGGDDYLGVRSAIDNVMRNRSGSDSVGPSAGLQHSEMDGAAKDLLADLDSFAPLTFDAGTLFRQSLLSDPAARNGKGGPPSSSSTASPVSPYYSRGGALSPAEYMATFSDMRSKLSLGPRKTSNGVGSENASGHHHRFFSKMKSAFSGGRHGQGSGPRQGRHRSASTNDKVRVDDKPPRIVDNLPPRLDFDLGTSLLTPDSTLQRSTAEQVAARVQTPQPLASTVSSQTPTKQLLDAEASQVANDSAYYLIDYINDADTSGLKAEISGSYTPSSASSAAFVNVSASSQQPAHSQLGPAARRIMNKSTRSRQTQYEYNFGSQIFECLDKDLMLLKTDMFKEFEDGKGSLGLLTADGAPKLGSRDGSSLAGSTGGGGEWGVYSAGLGDAASTMSRSSANAGGRRKRNNVDVTKATAYTAAAINRIVAHNAKARNAAVSVASPAAGNPSQLSRQLII
ncbi:hypothetical protein GGI07_000739 [Coemansia sp. Benny D115]|nr:hypothetical protein GGI07_000739 [Coemansia sp. Benny D115]